MGRNEAIDDVVRHVEGARLVTVVGPGGAGKTRLALEVATALESAGRPVAFVDLTVLSDSGSILAAVAAAAGVFPASAQVLLDTMADQIGDANAVVVLDNCEHLRAGCAQLVEALLSACGQVRVLATSRERLGGGGELVWRIPPLSLPERPVLPEAFVDSEAVQLFCQRAAAVQPGFLPTADNVEAIAEICRRLDGNALAIELAAARIVALPPAEIAARLDEPFGLLEAGPTTAPDRHRSLRATLEGSWRLLCVPERALLARLSVFPGSFGLGAVEEVCAGDGIERHLVLGLLASLVNKSLVVAEATDGAARFVLSDTVGSYARELRKNEGSVSTLAQRHAEWCAALVESRPGEHDESRAWGEWLALAAAEQHNVLVALEWALANRHSNLALRLVRGQMALWEHRGRYGEALNCLERVLAATDTAPDSLRASVLRDAGNAGLMAGDLGAAERHLRASLTLSAEEGEPGASIKARIALALASALGGDPAGVEQLERAVTDGVAHDDDALLVKALVGCGQARMLRGQPSAARPHFEAAVLVARRGGRRWLATSLGGLGSAELALGDYRAADENLHQAAAVASAAGDVVAGVVAKALLADLARLRGSHDEARTSFAECLEAARRMEAPCPLAGSLLGLARTLLDEGDAEGAQPLFDEAAAVSRGAGLAHLVAGALAGGGQAALALGDVAGGRARLDDALALARRGGDKVAEALALEGWAELSYLEGDLNEAGSSSRQALALHAEVGDPAAIARCVETLARFTSDEGSAVAARLLGAGDSLRRRHGRASLTSHPQKDRPSDEIRRHGSGQERVETEWRISESMSAESAVDCDENERGRWVSRPPSRWDALTEAEHRVAERAAQGRTNAQIARELGVADATVKAHLRRVFSKLGVQTRASLAAEAWGA